MWITVLCSAGACLGYIPATDVGPTPVRYNYSALQSQKAVSAYL